MMDRVLLIGDIERAEFARLMQALTRIYRVSVARNPRMALRAMRGGETWSRILLAPSFPGEFLRGDGDELRNRQPEAEISWVVGSWSEGETRSGQPWPDLPRSYVDQWLARCAEFSNRSKVAGPPAPSDPAERLGNSLPMAIAPAGKVAGRLTLCADDRAARDYLIEFGHSMGWQVQLHSTLATKTADDAELHHVIIYDGAPEVGARANRVRELVEAYPQTGLIVLIGFPREWEIAELTALGATAVLGKPFLNDDLCRYLKVTADINSAVRAA